MIQDMLFPCDSQSVLSVSLPAGCVTATFNISVAYCLTSIQPDQQHYLCVSWDGLIYIDCAVMFWLSSSMGMFGCVADMLVTIYKAAGFRPLLKWVNNLELQEGVAILHNPTLHWI